ncbi:MAG: universal stress protein [Cyclobacteriaceae bacterium]
MNLINKILIPIDFSDSSINAFHYAVSLVRNDRSIQITLLHVIERDDNPVEMMEAMSQFDTLKSYIPEYVDHLNIIVKHGRMIDTIVETTEELEPKIVLMGTKGKSKSLMHSESNTSLLVKKLDRSVLVVPQTVTDYQIKEIAVAYDQSVAEPSGLSVVHDLARWFGAKVHILTVGENKTANSQGRSEMEDTLGYYMDTLDYTYQFEENEDIVEGISHYIDENHINMLAILPNTHAEEGKSSKGSLTRVLTLQSKIPLLIID